MALSNWDTLAVNEKGEATNGIFQSPLGVIVEIYKNWLYIRDEKAWEEGGGYTKPTVMQVQEGHFRYKDVTVDAIRGPKDGVYCVVHTERFKPELDSKERYKPENVERLAMIGIGCYGFDNDTGDWLGVQEAEHKFLHDWIHKMEHVTNTAYGSSYTPGEEPKRITHTFEYDHYDFEEWIRNIPLDKALRFNQGDAYFASKLNFEVPATEPGKSTEPILTQSLKGEEKP